MVAKLETQLNWTVSSREQHVEEDLHWEAVEDRRKRQLPTTITPERSHVRKKRLESDGEQLKEKSPGKVNFRKIFFAESSTVSDSSDAEWWIAGIETFYTQTPEQVTLTLAGEDADICWIIAGA